MVKWCCRLSALWMFLMSFSGCALWHELQPHRLHRLNRTAPPHLDPEFSFVPPAGTTEPMIWRAQNED